MTKNNVNCFIYRDREKNIYLGEFGAKLLASYKPTYDPPDPCLERVWEDLFHDSALQRAFATKSEHIMPVVQGGLITYLVINPEAIEEDCYQFYEDQFEFYLNGSDCYLGSDD
jgi:hypothetical protein